MKKKITSVARGCGWQRIGALINLGAYYLMGIPSSIIPAFVYHLGGKVNKAANRVCSTTNLADALS
ncbi:hypothetical protein SCA6_011259 [Theobroma cacao]